MRRHITRSRLPKKTRYRVNFVQERGGSWGEKTLTIVTAQLGKFRQICGRAIYFVTTTNKTSGLHGEKARFLPILTSAAAFYSIRRLQWTIHSQTCFHESICQINAFKVRLLDYIILLIFKTIVTSTAFSPSRPSISYCLTLLFVCSLAKVHIGLPYV